MMGPLSRRKSYSTEFPVARPVLVVGKGIAAGKLARFVKYARFSLREKVVELKGKVFWVGYEFSLDQRVLIALLNGFINGIQAERTRRHYSIARYYNMERYYHRRSLAGGK